MMLPDFSGLLPNDFSSDSRVWIYQADRVFSEPEKQLAEEMIGRFTGSWRSHGAPVSGFGRIFFDRFVVLIADETAATVSGCSTDSSVQLIRDMEEKNGCGLFNRQLLAFILNEKIELIPLSRLSVAVRNGSVTSGSLFFNNAVTTLAEMRSAWIVPAGESWLQHRPAFAAEIR